LYSLPFTDKVFHNKCWRNALVQRTFALTIRVIDSEGLVYQGDCVYIGSKLYKNTGNMYQIYTSEQLQKELLALKKKKEEISNTRISALKKYNKGLNDGAKESELHNVDRKIEDLERKLKALL